MNVTVFVEGGGNTKALRARCRQGFGAYLSRAGLAGRMPRVVPSGSRQNAFRDFRTAVDKAGTSDFIVLLVDSEGPVERNSGPWNHLKNREPDNWDRPGSATDENAHMMVQCMEAWFLADQDGLASFFGDGFNRGALPHRVSIEEIPKADVERSLIAATRQCETKGTYHKGRHSFEILALVNPVRVMGASLYARRFIETLLKRG